MSLILFKRAFFFKNYFTETRGVNQKKFLLKLKNIFNLFDHKDHNLTFTLKQINKNSIKTLTKNKQKLLKQVVVQLRKYQNNEFFINSLNLFVNATNHKQNAARILSNLISAEITRLKRHTFFIRFMEAALLVIIKKRLSDVSGIKIQIKGRINGVPRAKTKYLIVGNSMTNFQIDSDLNYSEKVSHTKNGTLGVKVWVYY